MIFSLSTSQLKASSFYDFTVHVFAILLLLIPLIAFSQDQTQSTPTVKEKYSSSYNVLPNIRFPTLSY